MTAQSWLTIVVPVLIALIGAWFGLRGTRTTADTSALADAARYWQDATKRLDGQMQQMQATLDSMEETVDRVSRENKVLAHENRTFRDVLLGVIERLERIPPAAAAEVVRFILDRIPGLTVTERQGHE